MVFQGIVLGPWLFNVFVKDVHETTTQTNATEVKFADDINTFREFPERPGNDQILAELSEGATRLHEWGVANRVSFELSKDSYAVLDIRDGHGDPFKLLGTRVDSNLSMQTAVETAAKTAGPSYLLCCAPEDTTPSESCLLRTKLSYCLTWNFRLGRSITRPTLF